MPRYLIQHNNRQEFCVELRSPEGALLLDCLSFVTHAGALVGITNVRALSPFDSRYVRTYPDASTNSFKMHDYAEQTVARGPEHMTVEAREEAIIACQQFGPIARVVDTTGGPGAPPREFLR